MTSPTLRVVSHNDEREEIPHDEAWYFRKDTRPAGPHTRQEIDALIRKGRISADTLVWTQSLTQDWTAAGELEALQPLFAPREATA